ncbi:hypothetical protein CRENBAI_006569 [Crenichthys baileyi]|uniref:Uncharacterized protein n=1 Tax=Crenichthys baileyi TaxID=28760 RepID=A0AAV9R4Z1_9TELE
MDFRTLQADIRPSSSLSPPSGFLAPPDSPISSGLHSTTSRIPRGKDISNSNPKMFIQAHVILSETHSPSLWLQSSSVLASSFSLDPFSVKDHKPSEKSFWIKLQLTVHVLRSQAKRTLLTLHQHLSRNLPPGAQRCVWGSSLRRLLNVWRTKILHSEFCVGSRRIDRGAPGGGSTRFDSVNERTVLGLHSGLASGIGSLRETGGTGDRDRRKERLGLQGVRGKSRIRQLSTLWGGWSCLMAWWMYGGGCTQAPSSIHGPM